MVSPTLVQRYRALLRVNEVALTKFTMEELFEGMCAALRHVLQYDRAGLTLYDPQNNCLRIAALYGPYENSAFQLGGLLDLKTTQSGWAFEHRARSIRRDLSKNVQFASERAALDEGFRSLCSVPLIVGGKSIGAITVCGARKNQFSVGHAKVVQEVANQIVSALVTLNLRCPKHPQTKVICPRCIGAAGGKATVSRHHEDLSAWGKLGGRSRKNTD